MARKVRGPVPLSVRAWVPIYNNVTYRRAKWYLDAIVWPQYTNVTRPTVHRQRNDSIGRTVLPRDATLLARSWES